MPVSGRSDNYILTGGLVENKENSWKVLADNGETYYVSKQYADMYDDQRHWSIPRWLASKMGII